jgi:hypothetical protein
VTVRIYSLRANCTNACRRLGVGPENGNPEWSRIPSGVRLDVSHSGGMFKLGELVLEPLRAKLGASARGYRFVAARLTPAAGAALYAARVSGAPLTARAVATLASQQDKLPGWSQAQT